MIKNRCFICKKGFKNNVNLFELRGNCCKKCDEWAERISHTKGFNEKEELRSLWLEDYKIN